MIYNCNCLKLSIHRLYSYQLHITHMINEFILKLKSYFDKRAVKWSHNPSIFFNWGFQIAPFANWFLTFEQNLCNLLASIEYLPSGFAFRHITGWLTRRYSTYPVNSSRLLGFFTAHILLASTQHIPMFMCFHTHNAQRYLIKIVFVDVTRGFFLH